VKSAISIFAAASVTLGCASTGGLTGGQAVEMVDTRNDRAEAVVGIDYRDFEKAASDAVQSMLGAGAVDRPGGGRYILAVSRIINDTMQRIDTDQLIKKIRVDLLNSGKVVVTTAVGANGAEDAMNFQVREGLRGNEEFDQSRVQRKGTLQAPDLSLSGKIMQKNVRMPGGRVQIEYYFQLTLTDLKGGLALWENELPIIKRASGNTVTW
jgi:uncharacterized protein (TIGR02722 family)